MEKFKGFEKISSETTSKSSLSSSCQSPFSSDRDHHSPAPFITPQKKRLQRKSASFAYRIREHVRLGNKLSEMVKGKISVGVKIMRKGGGEKMFGDIFGVSECEGEKLLKASQCYLSTTAGPIAGILFVSTLKIAFCSERSIYSFNTPYKVCIPVTKIKGCNESENVLNPAQKYIQIVTKDNYEFWFIGFLRYEKAWINIQTTILLSNCN